MAWVWPDLSADELADMADDIREIGLLHLIVLDQHGAIVDGVQRLRACFLADVEPRFETRKFADDDAVAAYSWSLNGMRQNTATDTMMVDTRQWVCVRWDLFRGYYFVGPFAAAKEAGDWAIENEGTDICWQTAPLDPNVALEVRAPGKMPELEPDPEEPDHWTERQSDVGDFYLMIYSDPLHLIGPFPDHRHAYSWAVAYQARTEDEGWQVLWLNDPAAPARLLTPTEGVKAAAERDAENLLMLKEIPEVFRYLP